MVLWPEDRVCDRQWLLENVKGAVGIVVLLTDKVASLAVQCGTYLTCRILDLIGS